MRVFEYVEVAELIEPLRQLVRGLIVRHFLFIQLYPDDLAIVFVRHVIAHAWVKVEELHGKGAEHYFVEILSCKLVFKVDARG